MAENKLLDAKKLMKKKRPTFVRTDSHKLKFKGSDKWRKPKGLHNKMGDNRRGYRRCVDFGYRTPVELRNVCVNDGMEHVVVRTISDLQKIDTKTQAIMVAHTVGLKKQLDILAKALEMNIKVANIKDVKKYLDETKKSLDDKKASKKKKETDKEDRKKKREKEAKEKEEKDLEKTVEKEGDEDKEKEKKAEEKKEKDKVLTTKD